MKVNELVRKRFTELAEESKSVESTCHKSAGSFSANIDLGLFLKWTVKAKDLVSRTCGPNSVQVKEFEESQKRGQWDNEYDIFKRVRAVFEAAKEDFEAGYLLSVRGLIQAEVFDTELEQASEFLKLGYNTAAAVTAGVVLETAIRELCTRNSILHGKLDEMNADLAKGGIYNVIVQKRITHLAAVRNSAAHGNDAEFKTYDVKAMIGEVEQFLATHLS